MRLLLFIFTIGFIIGCNNPSDNVNDQSNIVATVGSENITADEIKDELNKMSIKQKTIYSSSPEKLHDFLETRINEEVLYNEALERGIQNREDINKNLERYKKKLLTKTLGKEILEELDISEEEIRSHYEENQQAFQRIDISKIFIRVDEKDPDSKEAAKSRAQLVSDRVESGESFEDIALEFSDDLSTKNHGGRAGYVNRGTFSKELNDEIFSLKEGEITKPFEVDDGYLIIKANKEPDFPQYSQVERIIRSKLINEKLLYYLSELREKWEVKVYKERLQEITKSEPQEK